MVQKSSLKSLKKTSKSIAIILAAGKGTRMNDPKPKPLVKVFNKPIIDWIIENFKQADIDVGLIINPEHKSYFKSYENVKLVFQEKQKGTGHATKKALKITKGYDNVFVFVGDSPFVKKEIIKSMLSVHKKNENDVTILSSIFSEKFFPYARIVRSNQNQKIIKIIEEFEANQQELNIKELFCSHYLFNSKILNEYIKRLKENSIKKEIFLTDIFKLLIKENKKVESILVPDWKRLVGLNSKGDINWIESQGLI
jgi:bifunctional UDP-N-acetylglucosamine pyrophosphorylase/glucosamine-1-phosphate N-acetyltransferase